MDSEPYDEAFTESGAPRPHYEPVFEALAQQDLSALRERVQGRIRERGISFGGGEPVLADPVPRVIDAAEWEALEAGICQRARALNAFLLDVYGEQSIFEQEVLPRRLLSSAAGYEPLMRGLLDPAAPPAVVTGLDLVREPGGRMLVLEDNARMPSGAAYALVLRQIVAGALGAGVEPLPADGYVEALGAALRRAAPGGAEGASVAVLSAGEGTSAWFEHRALAEALGVPVATPAKLASERGRLLLRAADGRRPVDVLYRRLDDERLGDDAGRPTDLGELLLPALRSGRLRCLNAFGAGIADDKAAHLQVERIVRFYLGEEPLLRSVPGYDLGDEAARGEALERLGELTVKPRAGFGGKGVTIMPAATAEERRRVARLVRERPQDFVAQETISLSLHPTVCDGRLEGRRVDLRPFAVCAAGETAAMCGGLTRFAAGADETIVNSSSGGGCKDTWVVQT